MDFMNTIGGALNTLGKNQNIPFDKLFTSDFMTKYTNVNTLEELLKKCNIANVDEIEKHLDLLNGKIQQFTKFSSWKEMLDAATKDFLKNKATNLFK
ncbi:MULTISPECIES: hypothetical protein [Fusobacterium]|jgi:glucosamine 6-phosphate synthetase-like amidotransferase/phosphosugar isomerase protein|uniref:Uncharacterized protein n=1 Tax=Fusobacterium hominis TaxID=2764326 RepID=A0A7G9GXZ2_9FUSO|nr:MULTISPECIES: hypothetical protein [Fusobacterium]QNM15674.1 hypothetical protein H9Q81_02195 [Fusobacterium hominis]